MNTKKENLNLLSETFKPDDVKFSLALSHTSSLQECIDNAEGIVTRLQQFVANGHSTEGLDFTYAKVSRY